MFTSIHAVPCYLVCRIVSSLGPEQFVDPTARLYSLYLGFYSHMHWSPTEVSS